MPDQTVRHDVAGGVATITLDSPETRNALSVRLITDLYARLAEASADDAVRVVVLTGTGPVFCAGADLKAGGGTGVPGEKVPTLAEVITAIETCPKPVVARVNGKARAGGIGLIAACDLAIAPESADFAFTEVRLGVVPAVIGAVVLPLLDRRSAQELFLTGATFDAARAVEIGLLTASAPDDRLDEVVDGYVQTLRLGAPNALAGTKTLLSGPATRATGPERPALLAELAVLSRDYFESDEAREGIASWRERRPASWTR